MHPLQLSRMADSMSVLVVLIPIYLFPIIVLKIFDPNMSKTTSL
jgi:hypothetical protein